VTQTLSVFISTSPGHVNQQSEVR